MKIKLKNRIANIKNLLTKKRQNIYQPDEYKIDYFEQMSHDTVFIKVKCNLNPLPGEFLDISLPGIGEAAISNASYNDKYVDFLIREVGNVTNASGKLKKGDVLLIRGPYGHGYPMEELQNNNIVLLGGGSGVAPPRSVLQYIEKNKSKFKDVYVFLGFRNPDEILFKDDVEKWSKKFKVEISVDKGDDKWKGNVGVITTVLEKSNFPTDAKFVICGPPIMIKFVIELLEKRGVSDENIYTSVERLMFCSSGKCGRCMIHGKYACKDGPVFKYSELKGIKE